MCAISKIDKLNSKNQIFFCAGFVQSASIPKIEEADSAEICAFAQRKGTAAFFTGEIESFGADKCCCNK